MSPKKESRTRQIMSFLDLRIGPATFAVLFAAGALWMKIDGSIDAQKQVAHDFSQHQIEDSKKFEKLTIIATKFEATLEAALVRLTRAEGRLDASGNSAVERR